MCLHPELGVGHPGVVRWSSGVVHRMISSCALGIGSCAYMTNSCASKVGAVRFHVH